MQVGIFGFQKTGKTTLFATLTGVFVNTKAYSTGKGETHMGMANVPDPRLEQLCSLFHPKKKIQAQVQYLDISGIQSGEATQADTFLHELKQMDALLHVVRAFNDPALPHSQGGINPAQDVATMETELILADHTVATRRKERLQRNLAKANRPEDQKELEILEKCLVALNSEIPLRKLSLLPEEDRLLRGFTFLSAKPLLVVLNMDESHVGQIHQAVETYGLTDFSKQPLVAVVAVSAKIEREISSLGPDDRKQFMQDLGISAPCLDRLIRSSYQLLGLSSFFTVGEDECKAWTIRKGLVASQAGGVIHSDIERGFIRAEVISHEELVALGSWACAKEKGKIRLEGKEYVVKDGDIVHFRFNV